MKRSLEKLRITAAYVTSLPFGRVPEDATQLEGLAKYLPAVGAIIGLILMGLAYCLHARPLPGWLTGTAVFLMWIILTGALHLDGLMDAADGIFSHRSRERMLEIMMDSRVGNFGVITGVCIMLMKVVALSAMSPAILLPSVLLVPIWARFCEAYAIGRFAYAKPEGMGKVWHDSMKWPSDLYQAAILPLVAMLVCVYLFGWLHAILISVCTVSAGIICANCIARVLDGHTGDTYGATVEFAEALGLFLTALLAA